MLAAALILFVLSFAIIAITVVGYSYMEEEMYYVSDGEMELGSKEYYEYRIESLKIELEDLNNGADSSNYQPKEVLENAVKMYQFIIDNELFNEKDWRVEAAYNLFNGTYNEEEKEFQDIKKTLESNDFEGYVRTKAEQTKRDKIEYINCEDGIENIYQYMVDKEIFDANDWRYEALTNLEILAGGARTDAEILRVKALNYQILNDIRYATTDINTEFYDEEQLESSMFMNVFGASPSVMIILCGIIIIFAGIIVATEHTTGTIKFLITNPVSRGKIIVSKYITIISLAAIGMLLLFGFNLVASMILCGAEGMDAAHLKVTMDGITQSTMIGNTFIKYCLEMVGVIAYGTMAFAISSFAKSTSVAVAAGIMCAMSGSIASQLLAQLHQDWGRYLIFSNTSLSTIYSGGSYYPNQSITFAITTVVIYVVIFFVIAYDGFTRREV